MTRIIFMGTPDFAAQVLTGLVESDYEIVAVVTQPDRPVGRKRVLTPSPVKQLALEHQLPVFQPEVISESIELSELINLQTDVIITAAYGQFLPKALLESSKLASINVHASLLPKYRGGAPIHYAIWQGEEETGVTIMYMVEEMDAGDIISQAKIPITSTDDVGGMFDKLAQVGKELLLETLPQLIAGEIEAVPQDASQVTYSPTIPRDQERIQWTQTAAQVDRHVRAFRPFPSTYSMLDGQRIKIWQGQPVVAPGNGVPGEILGVQDQRLLVQCGEDTVYGIEEWQESGKKRTSIQDWLNGNDPASIQGQVFKS